VWTKILVALSGTDTLEQPALQRALALAEKEITELELLQVVYDSSLESYPLMPRDEDYFDVRDMLVQRQSAGLERIVETLQWRRLASHLRLSRAVADSQVDQDRKVSARSCRDRSVPGS
jgi:hypothetical protein